MAVSSTKTFLVFPNAAVMTTDVVVAVADVVTIAVAATIAGEVAVVDVAAEAAVVIAMILMRMGMMGITAHRRMTTAGMVTTHALDPALVRAVVVVVDVEEADDNVTKHRRLPTAIVTEEAVAAAMTAAMAEEDAVTSAVVARVTAPHPRRADHRNPNRVVDAVVVVAELQLSLRHPLAKARAIVARNAAENEVATILPPLIKLMAIEAVLLRSTANARRRRHRLHQRDRRRRARAQR
jgi:hypothetical protein